MRRAIIYLVPILCLAAASAVAMDARGYFDLGVKSTETSEKIEYFTRALKLDPDLAEAYKLRGMLYYYRERYGPMIADYHSYIELVPGDAGAHVMLGVGYLKSGSCDTAIRYLDIAMEMDPGLTAAWANRAEARRLMGNYAAAVADSSRAIKLWGDPRSVADAFKTRAKSYSELGKSQEAYNDWSMAWQVDPTIPSWWKLLVSFRPEKMRVAGLIGIIAIALVLIFRLRLKPPEKEE